MILPSLSPISVLWRIHSIPITKCVLIYLNVSVYLFLRKTFTITGIKTKRGNICNKIKY